MPDSTNLWMVNQYALRAHQAGGTRHAQLAKGMRSHGIHSLLVTGQAKASPHSRGGHADLKLRTLIHDTHASFLQFRLPSYGGNGARRLFSMLVFAVIVFMTLGISRPRGLKRPDVVLGSSPHLFGAFAAWLLATRYRVPFMLEIRDIWPLSFVSVLGLSPRHPLIVVLGFVERFLYRRAVVVVTLLEGAEEHVREQVGEGAPPVVWIPNGVEPTFANEPTSDSDVFRVIYAGAHGPANSLDTLLEAAEILEREQPGRFAFTLVGDGPMKNALRAHAVDRGIESVVFADPVPRTDIPALLAKADALAICLLDSPLYDHGISPNKLFDYMASGRPVVMAISTRFDPVAKAGAGVSVRSEDPAALASAFQELAETPLSQREDMGQAGRRYVLENHNSTELSRRLALVVIDCAKQGRN